MYWDILWVDNGDKNFYYTPSASTKYSDTFTDEKPSQYCCKGTNLLLIACKTKNWQVVKKLLQLDPEKYPKLFQSCKL